MATNPSTPGGNPPASGNGSSNPGAKPRATIVMKNPNANPGGAQVVPTAPSSAPGGSQRLPRNTGSVSSPQSSRRQAITTDREALGLSAARPSEMVAGLDEAAKRAEALAEREEAKRKSGGKMNATIALHVDDTGRKWARWVLAGICVAVLGIAAFGALLLWGANHRRVDPRVALAETKSVLADLETATKKMPQFEGAEVPTAPAARTRLVQYLDGQMDAIQKSLLRDREAGRNPDRALVRRRDDLEKLLKFTDGWDKPLEFTVDGDDLSIRSNSKADGAPIDPVKIRVRGATAEKPPEPQ